MFYFLPTKAEAVFHFAMFFKCKLCSHEIDLEEHKEHFFFIIKIKSKIETLVLSFQL